MIDDDDGARAIVPRRRLRSSRAAAVSAAVALAAQSPQQLRTAILRAASARHSVHYVTTSSIPGHVIRMVADVGRGELTEEKVIQSSFEAVA